MRDRLIGLLKCFRTPICEGLSAKLPDVERLADHLLANGVIVKAHGEWKKVSEKYPRYVCTACNHLYNNKGYKYCPECGSFLNGEDGIV